MSPEISNRRWRLAVRLLVAAFVWSLGLVLAAVLVPVYGGQTESGVNGLTLTTATFVAVNGGWTLVPIGLPAVVACLTGLAMRRQYYYGGVGPSAGAAWVMVLGLAALALLASLTFGLLVVPAAVLLGLGLSLVPPQVGASESDRDSQRRRLRRARSQT